MNANPRAGTAPGEAAPANPAATEANKPTSTASLTASLGELLSNSMLVELPGANAGLNEPSPADVSGESQAPSPELDPVNDTSADDEEPMPQGQAPEWAMKTITGLRASKRELKAKMTEMEQRLLAYEAKAKTEPAAGDTQPATPPPQAIAGLDPEVQQIVQLEQQVERNLQTVYALKDELREGGFEAVQQRFAQAGLQLPAQDEAQLARWIETQERQITQQFTRVSTAREVAVRDARRKIEAQRAETEARVAKQHPWWNKQETPEWRDAQGFIKRFPGIMQLPDGPEMLAWLIAGKHASAARTTPAPMPARSAKLPGAATSLPRSSAAASEAPNASVLLAKYRETRDPKDKEAWLKAVTLGV